jgi:hypothetical protein
MEIEQKSCKALISGIDVLRGTELVKPEDFQFLHDRVEQYEKRFRTRAIFRSRTEMIAGVLSDSEHPTVDSKYWQAIGEQNVHLTELINLSYEAKKLEADNEFLSVEIEEIEDKINKSNDLFEVKKLKAQVKKKKIELAQAQFGMTQQQKTAQERLREVKLWDEIIAELEPNLEFGSEDFELHHPKRYMLRYQGRMQNFDKLDQSAKESVLTHYNSFLKMVEDGGSPLPKGISNNTKQVEHRQVEQKQVKNIPPNVTESCDVDYASPEEMNEKDAVAKSYFNKKVRKILVATPHRRKEDGNVTNFFAMQTPAGYTCSITEPYGYTVADAQNYVVQKAIDEGYDYIFFVEDDVLIPRSALVQLIQYKTDAAGGLYYRKYLPLETAGMHYDKEGYPSSINDYEIGDVIKNTLVLCSGCTLIKVETLKRIEFPWYKSINVSGRPALTSDTYICQKMRDIGAMILTDTGVQCLHIDRAKGLIYGNPLIVDYDKNEIRQEWREYFAI